MSIDPRIEKLEELTKQLKGYQEMLKEVVKLNSSIAELTNNHEDKQQRKALRDFYQGVLFSFEDIFKNFLVEEIEVIG